MRRRLPALAPLIAATVIGTGAAVGLGTPAVAAPSASPAGPGVHSPEYVARDAQNMVDAFGRIHGPGGQLRNPAYLQGLVDVSTRTTLNQLLAQLAAPTRPSLTPAVAVPGWNVGNPLRKNWERDRGRMKPVQFTNRYGALLRGHVYRPLPGAKDPYTGKKLKGPFPGVVITTGSVQGSEAMYEWLAQDLAERGYVVLTYDVQGQGDSETLPHESGETFPFCDPSAEPREVEMTGCPGVPFQQLSNFVVGTRDAIDFFMSTPKKQYANPGAADAAVDGHNPFWKSFDRRKVADPYTPGRRTKLAIIGHSMGASAVSKVQGDDKRVMAVVALDKLTGPDAEGALDGTGNMPVVPALALQAEYGFAVTPYLMSGGSSITPSSSPDGPDPRRERASGYDAWADAGVDTMLIVPRASTHLEWTDIPLVLPASRYGQALSSVYTQLWLDRYLKGKRNDGKLFGKQFAYLEPVSGGFPKRIKLDRDEHLSFYYCSAYRIDTRKGVRRDGDITNVGC